MTNQKHCCNMMHSMLLTQEIAIKYIEKFREYGIAYTDGGTSYQVINYCPWCGSKLPSTLREKWFDELEKLGCEPGDDNIPSKFLTAEWYQQS